MHPVRRIPKPSTNRLFRGPTPSRVFQTIHLGAGFGEYALAQAKKFPNRKYVVVDPVLHVPLGGSAQSWRIRNARSKLVSHGVKIYSDTIEKVLPRLVKMGFKTRHLSMVMPSDVIPGEKPISYTESSARFKERVQLLFEMMPKLLLPNGKLFVTTESKEFVELFKEAAQQYGFSFRQQRNIPFPSAPSTTPEHYDVLEKMERKAVSDSLREWYRKYDIFRIEITFPLTKAIPQKSKRRNWPNNGAAA